MTGKHQDMDLEKRRRKKASDTNALCAQGLKIDRKLINLMTRNTMTLLS